MNNREVYEKDPLTNRLLNQGVAKVSGGQSDSELETLRFEVANFVCDGQYAEGLTRILSAYLDHLDKTEQPGVWVSGFYGAGKSHLVKMLQHLWIDYEFSDGARTRGISRLPDRVKELLKELSNRAKRFGGLHAAAGTLGAGAGDSVRLELLGIIFRSVGLPEHYAQANFLLWLRHEELEEVVRKHIKGANRHFEMELANLYVSDVMARAILAARPGFAAGIGEVKTLLGQQFPEKSDVSIEEMIGKIKQALGRKGKLPCTLIVLDEVQQYIGENVNRSKAVQDLQEQCCARLGASVLFVATGQNALSGIPQLQRLQGRFPVSVELQDTDVEQVTREVVLKKKPSAEGAVKKLLADHSGEVERQLSGTRIAFNTRDRSLLVQDYPILPVRRRFWERVLRAVDKAGTGAQLRTQLWIVYDAAQQTASKPLGSVVSGAFLFEHIKSKVLQSGVLLQELSETIARQTQEDDGELRYQLCALIFLIGQLPHQGPADAGVRANAETLADLLVTDLTQSSAALRKKVPDLLGKLVTSGAVMLVEDEYRMQTREGSEWNQAFLEARNKLLADPGKLAGERSQLLKTHCSDLLKKTKFVQGQSKVARQYDLRIGGDAPRSDSGVIPVWIRDGWEVEERSVVSDARAAGDKAAIVFGFVPKTQPEELKQAIASYYAATATIQTRGVPTTPEGIEARKAMETRQEQALRTRDNLINDILNETAIYVAGGDAIGGLILEAKVQDAAKICLDRLFPSFHQADSPDWYKAIDRAKAGDGDAMSAVGHKGDPESHAVCKAVHVFVGSGKKGTEIRKHFGASPWGWPQDAIDAALLVLFGRGMLQVRSGSEPVGKGKLDQKNIAAADFRIETITLSTTQLIDIRGLYKKVGLNAQPGQESAHALDFLDRLKKLAAEAGGDRPRPTCPSTAHLAEIGGRVGNDQLAAIAEGKKQLGADIAEWAKRRDGIAQRMGRWDDLTALLGHASGLPVAAEVGAEARAIEDQRSLLNDPNPVPGLIDRLTQALRDELNRLHVSCELASMAGQLALSESAVWGRLSAEQRQGLLASYQLTSVPPVAVGSTAEVLESLQKMKLSEWRALCDALPTRFSHALADAAKLLEPKAQLLTLPTVTIKDESDLAAWLAQTGQRIREKLKVGPVIV